MDLSLAGLWASMGWPARSVFFLMVGMLIACLYVAIERFLALSRARAQSRSLAAVVGGSLKGGDIAGALAKVSAEEFKDAYLGAVLKAGLIEMKTRADKHGVAAAERTMDVAVTEHGARLRKGMNILATTGSTTPFVGLVGTIFGIINSFSKMAEAGGGDLTAISGGIAEALVSTAVGISVAIVGVWLYNYFNALLDDITKDMSTASKEFLDWSEKEVLRRDESQAAK